MQPAGEHGRLLETRDDALMTNQKRSCARLHLLGRVRLSAADGRDLTPRGQKARGLLAMLALARDGRLARATAAARLWSASHDAKANLRQCLRELRATLGAADADLLQADDQTLVLDCQRLAIDVRDLDEGGADPTFDLGSLDDDCLLRDIQITDPAFDEWLTPERARARDLLHHGLEARADACLARGEPAEALRWATRLIGFDPTLETAYRALMRAHADQGNRSLALRQFEICRERLVTELGVGPSEATLALRARIARPPQAQPALSRPGARQPSPPLRPDPKGAGGEPQSWSVDWLAQHGLGPPILCADDAIRVALTPLNVLSEVGEDQLHAMIVSEAMAAALSRFTDLAVIDPAAANGEPGHAGSITYRVDGSLARLGETRRLTIRLWRALDGMLLWAEPFALEPLPDGDALDQLALRIAGRLEEAVLSRETQEPALPDAPPRPARRLPANAAA
jgi:DNA-binding SARP family transcriptional activator/TolB-like protein